MKERRFALSLGASVFLHAALLLAVWYAPRLFERPPAPSRTISLDMLGIVKDRAVVEQRKQTPTPPVEQAPPPPPKPKPKIPPVSTESAVKITEEKREKPAPIAPTTPPLER
jgi:outer membrane biosynthesis protein TonB